MPEFTNKEIIHPELSYKIVGVLFNVSNELGFGLKEHYYQKGIQIELEKNNIKYSKEFPIKITYGTDYLGTNFIDFLIEDEVVLEIKKGDRFSRKDIDQTYKYLVQTNKKLGILARFTKEGVKYKRILNLS